jgi:xanthine dehydrogenase accessory factor
MKTQDFDVLSRALEWSEQGKKPWLCTIVQATGSSPRPVGSMLVCIGSSQQVGSVSGGCVEEDLLAKLAANKFDGAHPTILEYGVSAAENERLGLPCGGKLTLLLQQLTVNDTTWLEPIVKALQDRCCIQRELSLVSGETELTAVEHFTGLALDEDSLQQCFGPRMRMLLVGAGQLSQVLSELALAMDYEVIVTDTRSEVLAQWQGPDVPLLQGMPDDIVRAQAADRFSIVITLTHDPRIDDMALMEALTTQAWYVGALGSMRTTEMRRVRLRELQLSDAQIAALHAPVGMEIGSKTPIEIAVAIMAELTQLRRRPRQV